MRIYDFHTHAFADEIAERAITTLEEQGDTKAFSDGTIDGLIDQMDRAGIDVSVLMPVATKASQVCTINDWVASLASDRIVPFGSMHPDFADPAGEFARLKDLGIKGFKMHPEYQDFDPLEPRMEQVYEAARDTGMIAFFHSGGDIAFDSIKGTPEVFSTVIDAYPGLTLVLAHMGGFRTWQGAAEHLAGRDIWLDTAYTLTHLPDDEFLALARAHGTKRVLFGTDAPWTDAERELQHIRSMGFSAEELDDILGGNAQRLLGL
jgi:uncharacterized protein